MKFDYLTYHINNTFPQFITVATQSNPTRASLKNFKAQNSQSIVMMHITKTKKKPQQQSSNNRHFLLQFSCNLPEWLALFLVLFLFHFLDGCFVF